MASPLSASSKKEITIDFSWIDSTTLAIHRHGSGLLKKGASKRGTRTQKHKYKHPCRAPPSFIHSACLSEGQRVDMKVFLKLWSQRQWDGITHVIADKGYDYYDIRHPLKEAGKIPVISRRSGTVCPGVRDQERYQTRSNLERFFGKIKENKNLTMSFDNLDVTFFSFSVLAALKVLNLFC